MLFMSTKDDKSFGQATPAASTGSVQHAIAPVANQTNSTYAAMVFSSAHVLTVAITQSYNQVQSR
jgi:hypothetical protein